MTNESNKAETILNKHLNALNYNESFFDCGIKAMQEYSSIQLDTYKKSLLSYLEHEQDGGSDDSEYKALEMVIQFINAKHIDNQILSNTKP